MAEDGLRALSLHQPWASLVALGVKSIETRSWSTSHRGRLLVHATKRRPDFAAMKSLVADRLDVWNAWYAAGLVSEDGETDHLPRGAVVASAVLTDVVPIVDRCPPSMDEPPHVCVRGYALHHRPEGDPFPNGDTERDVSDEVPLGDFAPGRFAWLLEDVKPTTERCPRCWGCGVAQVLDGDAGMDLGGIDRSCSTCRGMGLAKAPVPMRGRQGLWRPSWEAA